MPLQIKELTTTGLPIMFPSFTPFDIMCKKGYRQELLTKPVFFSQEILTNFFYHVFLVVLPSKTFFPEKKGNFLNNQICY